MYCEHSGLPPDQFHRAVLRRTLYPHARLLAPLIRFFKPSFFVADYDFVEGVGRVVNRRTFRLEVGDFQSCLENRRFSRRVLRLRVSVGRMAGLVERVLREDTTSATNFLHPNPASAGTAPSNPGMTPPESTDDASRS